MFMVGQYLNISINEMRYMTVHASWTLLFIWLLLLILLYIAVLVTPLRAAIKSPSLPTYLERKPVETAILLHPMKHKFDIVVDFVNRK